MVNPLGGKKGVEHILFWSLVGWGGGRGGERREAGGGEWEMGKSGFEMWIGTSIG